MKEKEIINTVRAYDYLQYYKSLFTKEKWERLCAIANDEYKNNKDKKDKKNEKN